MKLKPPKSLLMGSTIATPEFATKFVSTRKANKLRKVQPEFAANRTHKTQYYWGDHDIDYAIEHGYGNLAFPEYPEPSEVFRNELVRSRRSDQVTNRIPKFLPGYLDWSIEHAQN